MIYTKHLIPCSLMQYKPHHAISLIASIISAFYFLLSKFRRTFLTKKFLKAHEYIKILITFTYLSFLITIHAFYCMRNLLTLSTYRCNNCILDPIIFLPRYSFEIFYRAFFSGNASMN